MKGFHTVEFKGKFRSYQQRVLDQSDVFLKDRKLHIVAAPGSGKTILGLELIKRLGSACIILSPTQTIRDQWIDRFKESFLPSEEDIEEYASTNLNQSSLINSITYQALYAAINRLEECTEEEQVNYSKLDIYKLIHQMNIHTICLDEAHHLQNEWQKALEKFIKTLEHDVTIISLTATPPYDAKTKEWERYISICGSIDDEIFVPELVKEHTLCPHQDYIMFNYPEQEEIESLSNYRENVYKAVASIGRLPFLSELNQKLFSLYQKNEEYFYDYYKSVISVMVFFNFLGFPLNKDLFYKLTLSKTPPSLTIGYMQTAIEFLLFTEWISEANKYTILEILKEYEVYERNRPCLDMKESLKKNLVSSTGKLHSIIKIVNCEKKNLKEKLRLLILTDYIKKESLAQIGQRKLNQISVVSIFDALHTRTELAIGCISGSLVILPVDSIEKLSLYGVERSKISFEFITNTKYVQIIFRGNQKQKVKLITKLFEDGVVQVLIGTQALLGEGWDSPCINSLILASYVGSFMLSNQMRGRAIRSYKDDPSKTANIWHLVTLEPSYVLKNNIVQKIFSQINEEHTKLVSCDFETLTRRFDCFLGPNYDTNEIESGIQRVTIIKPPFDKKNIDKINQEMLLRSCNRKELNKKWEIVLEGSTKTVTEAYIPKNYRVPTFTYFNFIGLFFAGILQADFIYLMVTIFKSSIEFQLKALTLILLSVLMIGVGFLMSKIVRFIILHSSPKKTITNLSSVILNTFKELGLIHYGAHLKIDSDPLELGITISISNATVYEQNIFNKAIEELLSPIQNPKFLIIKKNGVRRKDYKYSFACPTAFSKKENAVIFKKNLEKIVGTMDLVYAYNEAGRRVLRRCKKKSFITKNQEVIFGKQKVSKFE